MTNVLVKRRKVAIILLLIWCFNLLVPSLSFALTSGPAQPETKGFQPASVSDMVDLQSGDLKYNIPLLDIDGYPLNLNYQSGTGIDDEASWVGLGWSLNPGAINRQVRGIPDDFRGGDGGDVVETDHYVKPKVTVGGRLTAKIESRGKARLGGSVSFGIFSDNYTGLGAELGVNAGISFSMANDGFLTAGLGVGVLSNTQSGVDASVSPYVSMSLKMASDNNFTTHAGLSGSFGYNTRSGLKSLTLGASFGASNQEGEKSGSANYSVGGSTITYNTEPISPSIQIPYFSTYDSFSFDVGPAAGTFFASIGGTGYQNVRSVATPINRKPAYGFLYADAGKNDKDAVMDFFREKDNPIIPELPNIALPIHTPDTWSYTSQTGSGQFRLFRSTGAFFDNESSDESKVGTAGGDVGGGAWFHGGITKFNQETHNTTRKWKNSNAYLANGDFQSANNANPKVQHVYFRQVGEKGVEDQDVNGKLYTDKALEVSISGVNANNSFRTKGGLYNSSAPELAMAKTNDRRANRTMISYHTAAEATLIGFDKTIKTFAFNNVGATLSSTPTASGSISRVGGQYKPHHISEMTITDDGGKRMIYGIPVYNKLQDEYSFAIGATARDTNNLVNVPNIASYNSNTLGIDNYYHKESKPGYATSYLLTAILSPDYVDRTGNGITDDDLGTPIKFNYSKTAFDFKWRTPFNNATANKCLNADPDDDKGSIVYGEKELYYVHSIETKTKIAYFITENRRDALGVLGWQNGQPDNNQVQKCLREIRLYSKADMTRPIKVVKFQYTYELCRGIPNTLDPNSTDVLKGGKLTLARVWFEYGNSDKGKFHPYIFQYNKKNTNYPTGELRYKSMYTDRWGVYKKPTENSNTLDNEQYPYANQNDSFRDQNASLWHLNQVTMPTGGVINISYESNDYAYVQDQKAMVMTGISGMLVNPTTTTNLLNQSRGLKINIGTDSIPPAGVDQTTWFKNTFLNGSDYMYTKLCVQFTTNNSTPPGAPYYDFVPTYCQVSSVTIAAGVANVMFVPVTESKVTTNPISISAWQRLKNEYPRYAYPGYDNRVKSGNSSIIGAISAIISAAKNLSELSRNFYEKANSRNYASNVLLNKSFARITKVNGFKLGGGARVKKISIADSWNTTVNPNVTTAAYGQAYSYTTIDNGKIVSSGVATYEPSVGNDENPLKQPVPYISHIKGAINNYFELEKPFGESLYPAPSIGYSKVTVQDLDKTGNPTLKTGSVVSEFYTARDFPVKVTVLPLISFSNNSGSGYSLVKTSSDQQLCLSQGYSIELNDMHGKPKASRVLNQSGAEISSTVYYYSMKDNGGSLTLNNNVPVVNNSNLLISNQIMGRDIDFFTDFREQESNNKGSAINIGIDVFPIPIFIPAFPLPHFPVNDNNEHKLFRSASALKVIQTYGIISKVVKTQNGSSVATENLAYDALTGEAVVTRTKNEFKKDLFSVNIPAYWAYQGMGAAYKNLGVLLSGFTTNAQGEVSNSSYASILQGGDEIVDVSTGNKFWVIDNQAAAGGTTTTKKLIDQAGIIKASLPSSLVKIVRSGFRNMLGDNATTLVSLNSPFTADNHLKLVSNADLTSMRVINASASVFDESWSPGNCCNTKVIDYANPTLNLTENTSRDFSLSATSSSGRGLFLRGSDPTSAFQNVASAYWGGIAGSTGRLGVIGFWPTEAQSKTYNDGGADPNSGDYFGFDVIVTFPESKVYFFVMAGVQAYVYTVDCSSVGEGFNLGQAQLLTGTGNFVPAGKHIVHVSYKLGVPFLPLAQRTMGLEIYNNTYSELVNADSGGTGLNLLFSTKNFVGNNNVYSFFDKNGVNGAISDAQPNTNQTYHYTKLDGTSPLYKFSYCAPPLPPVTFPIILNPYTTGYLGNWRPSQTKVLQQNRNYSYTSNITKSGIDVKNAGYISGFNSYWYFNGTTWVPNPNATKWVTANTVTLYDKFGQQLENKDALGRFSAAEFDFNGELPSAVASNAMNREIYAASLEDNQFTFGSSAVADTCNVREFIQPSNKFKLKQLAVNTISHSGNYSVKLPTEGVKLSTIIHSVQQKSTPYLTLDAQKQYNTLITPGLYPNGFEPYPGKKYIFNAWVNDGVPNDKSINVSLTINNNNVPLTCKAVVEGWKLVEGVIDLSTLGAATTLDIAIVPTGGAVKYIDDIRIHPFDAHMKTYAYDDKTMRLMAEMDENSFATFYEYDDEGLLIRVKKETEKGIMTVKESRSTYRRNQK
jgi:hypothetical protein